ncbi:MAG: hypothetical protein ACI81R_002158 [Bradymonadia bacterium]|jgi:hypothetical protein
MAHSFSKVAAIALATLLFTPGCSDEPRETNANGSMTPEATGGRGAEQALTIRTHFVVEGLDAVGDRVGLERLYINVGALLLEPLDGTSSVTFSNREPFALEFDIASGEYQIAGPEMQLPYGGEFAVMVQIEPRDTELSGDKDASDYSSVEVDGHVLVMSEVDPGNPEGDEPCPVPWMPGDKSNELCRSYVQEVPFSYRIEEVARVHLAEIRLDDQGEYDLTLRMSVGAWLADDVLPAIEDLTRQGRQTDGWAAIDLNDSEGADMAQSILGDGFGIERLVGDIEATTDRR